MVEVVKAVEIGVRRWKSQVTDDLQLANLFNKYFPRIGSELRHQKPNNGRDPLKFFDDADINDSLFRFYESKPSEVAMSISKFPNKGSPPHKIPN